MSRRLRLTLIGAGVLLFLVISGLLARFLGAENVERAADLALLQAEARGQPAAMLAMLHGCAGACASTVRADAAGLRGPGAVTILAFHSATAYAVGAKSGNTRIAWKLPGRLPTVQCVLVRRAGNAVAGISVSLLAIGAPIPRESDCS